MAAASASRGSPALQRLFERDGIALSDDGLRVACTLAGGTDAPADQVRRHVLNLDLRRIGLPSLEASVSTAMAGRIRGPVMLQVVSVHNLSQPSYTQTSNSFPRLLGVRLTDGHTKVTAVEVTPIKQISYVGVRIAAACRDTHTRTRPCG